MSINQSHSANGNGVILFYGERLLIYYDGCDLKLNHPTIKGIYLGRVYLTSHRVIFVNKKNASNLLSFSMPFIKMSEIDIKQPVFGANRIEGKVTAEGNGGWEGQADFSLTFKKGGAIEFGQTLIELGKRACAAQREFKPPAPYAPVFDMNGAAQYYACPPPAYSPPYNDPYYGFVRPHEAFTVPEAQTLYHTGAPPPYPGAGPVSPNYWNSAPSNPQPGFQGNFQPGTTSFPGTNMSASHAAKAAEAAASGTTPNNFVTGGYYFPEDPHTVYAQPSAPPYPCPGGNPGDEPPPYPGSFPGTHNQDPINKKNQ